MKVDVDRPAHRGRRGARERAARVFTKIRLRFRVWGQGLAREQVERAVQLSLDKYCSVAAMLRSTAGISYDIILEEA